MAIRKGPRKCKRCGKTKAQGDFTPHGKICWDCKVAATRTLDARRDAGRKKYAEKRFTRDRACRKCGVVKPASAFTMQGRICLPCKEAAKNPNRAKQRQAYRARMVARRRAAASIGGETKLPARIYMMGTLL